MIFEDLANIGLLCALMGVGAVAFVGIALLYLATAAIMEDHCD